MLVVRPNVPAVSLAPDITAKMGWGEPLVSAPTLKHLLCCAANLISQNKTTGTGSCPQMEGTLTSARHSLAQGCIQLCPDQAAISGAGRENLSFRTGTLHVEDKCPLTGLQATLFCRAQWGRSHFLHTFGNLSVLFFKILFIYFFSGSRAKHSHPLGADPRGDSVNLCSLVDQSPKVSWVRLARGMVGLESPTYFITSSIKQRACVCNSLLMKPSDTDKGTQ